MIKIFTFLSLIIIFNSFYLNPGYSNASYIVLINDHYSYSEKFMVMYLNNKNYSLSTQITYPNGKVMIYYSNISYNDSNILLNILNLDPKGPFPEINSSIIKNVENDSINKLINYNNASLKWKFTYTNTYIGNLKSILIILDIKNLTNHYSIRYYANFSLENGLLLNENITKFYDGNYSNESIILSYTNLFRNNLGILSDLAVFVVILLFIIIFVYFINKRSKFIENNDFKKLR